MIKRRKTRKIFVGQVPVGGDAPISVQSMTKTDTRDIKATARQIRGLERAGCEIIRLAVPDIEAARAIGGIKRQVSIPVIADIHFDWRLALESINQGVNGLRINPGNIGAKWKVKEVVKAAGAHGVPIRIGVNSGSLEKDILKKYGRPTPEALVESAAKHIEILEDMDFRLIKVSLKGSGVPLTVDAYRSFSERFDYPLHVGITEAGPPPVGVVKSATGIGILLNEGIGDTIRVSLTAPSRVEVEVAYEILKSLDLRQRGVNIISCPTCGRCNLDIIRIAKRIHKNLQGVPSPLTVAVMGCVVNGPGEAREADFGIAGGKGEGIVFKKGKVIKRVKEEELIDALMEAVEEDAGWR
ncbi:(E)-4-hydroxy-3-methylbut-2-enyl-diphosphate synthase (flavodoxin) [hydrothermal vent metagenome]|uniref:(E)-4-hydroxy-3-methylbut-2-enyl-diphosphate synthase (Flavodoxin) n=1 Tax=hydrothermal vent metagenome TaxID=652676 RepID=A0A3B1CT69_9ZZZZ